MTEKTKPSADDTLAFCAGCGKHMPSCECPPEVQAEMERLREEVSSLRKLIHIQERLSHAQDRTIEAQDLLRRRMELNGK